MASKKARGKRAKTRSLFKRGRKPKLSVNKLVQEFGTGQRVIVKIDPGHHRGMPHKRFHGKQGKVVGKQGNAFMVEVKKGSKAMQLFVPAAHLLQVQQK